MPEDEKYNLEVEIEDPEEIPEELGSGVPKTPYVSVMGENGEKVNGEYTDEDGYVNFELPEGDYGINAFSLTRHGYKEIHLDGDVEVPIKTEFRKELRKTFSQIL